jgi:Family of unknown function (DUF6171)
MSKWEQWKKSVGETRPWHLLDEDKLLKNQEIVDNRMSICHECPFFISFTTQCKKCGCFMKAKTTLKNAECPMGKW